MATRRIGKARLLMIALLVLGLVALALAVSFIEKSGITPRALAPYIAKRTSGHNPTIVGAGALVAQQLTAFDRGATVPPPQLRMRLGAQADAAPARIAPGAHETMVSNADEAR